MSQSENPQATSMALRFGIPSLDELLRRDAGTPLHASATGLVSDQTLRTRGGMAIDTYAKNKSARTTGCIIGPDGTGKSILALHLASRYIADANQDDVKVLYASTDLSYAKAFRIWAHFGLGHPNLRSQPFTTAQQL